MGKNTPNHVVNEKSPYLQQHAHNPVDWRPWGSEARARAGSKPILLSIGQWTCHWCHFMAQESFSDKTIADLMNRHFICINQSCRDPFTSPSDLASLLEETAA